MGMLSVNAQEFLRFCELRHPDWARDTEAHSLRQRALYGDPPLVSGSFLGRVKAGIFTQGSYKYRMVQPFLQAIL